MFDTYSCAIADLDLLRDPDLVQNVIWKCAACSNPYNKKTVIIKQKKNKKKIQKKYKKVNEKVFRNDDVIALMKSSLE